MLVITKGKTKMNEQITLFNHRNTSGRTQIIENQSYRGVILYVRIHKSPHDIDPSSDGSLSIQLTGHLKSDNSIGINFAFWEGAYQGGPQKNKAVVVYPGVEESPHQLADVSFYPVVLPAFWSVNVNISGEGWEYSVEASLQG